MHVEKCIVYAYIIIYVFRLNLTQVHDSSNRTESDVVVSHISKAPVLSRSEVYHPSSVVGLLIHEPVAIHHMTGLAVGHAVTIHERVTVICQLVHLTCKAVPLVDSHSVGSPVL